MEIRRIKGLKDFHIHRAGGPTSGIDAGFRAGVYGEEISARRATAGARYGNARIPVQTKVQARDACDPRSCSY